MKERNDLNLSFVEVKDKDPKYQNRECEMGDLMIRILKNKDHPFYSVYAKRYVESDGMVEGYIEISSVKAETLVQAKQVAEKMYNIVLGYNVPGPGKEY